MLLVAQGVGLAGLTAAKLVGDGDDGGSEQEAVRSESEARMALSESRLMHMWDAGPVRRLRQ